MLEGTLPLGEDIKGLVADLVAVRFEFHRILRRMRSNDLMGPRGECT
jgi:hypothetical protein